MKNVNLNADFLLDIWADLKAKKLAPVAVGLVVAVVAMPALLLKGEDAPTAGPLPIIAPTSADTAEVEVAEELAEGDSKLDSYKGAHDPFDGLVKPQADDAATGSGAAIAPSDLIGDAVGKDVTSGPSLGSSGGSAPSDSLGASPDPGGLGTPGSGNSEPPVVVKRPGARFTYQLDVKFGRPGRENRYPNLARMSFLPNPKVPALLFMGVTADEKSALFFVHPTLSHQGEGKCSPSNAVCNFLELKIGQEHFLSVDDLEFRIRLLGIKRVKLSTEKKQRAAARKTSATHRSGRADGDGPVAASDDAGAAAFDLPWLVDGIG